MSHTTYSHNPKIKNVPSQPYQKVQVVNSVQRGQGEPAGGVTPMIGRSGSSFTKDVDPELVEAFLNGTKNAVMALHEFAAKQRLSLQFRECNVSQGGSLMAGMTYYTGSFACKAIINGIEYEPGRGKTKKEAKTEAAKNAFANLLGIEREDVARPQVHTYGAYEDSYAPVHEMAPPQGGFSSGSHFQLGFDTAAPLLTSEDAWNLPDHGTYAAYQAKQQKQAYGGQSAGQTSSQATPAPQLQQQQQQQYTPQPQSAPTSVPQQNVRQQQPQYYPVQQQQQQPVVRTLGEDDYPPLQAGPPTKSAWGKGPPQLRNNNTVHSNTGAVRQQYPPNNVTPSEYLQHRAQTQRQTYEATPRQPFPQYSSQETISQAHPMMSQGPPIGQQQQQQQQQRVPQQQTQSSFNTDWANKIMEIARTIPPINSPFPGSDGIRNNQSYAAFVVSQNDDYQLVSLGTGESVIQPSGLTKDGRCVLDCTGLTIARRGLQRYLYRELKHFLDGLPSIFIKSQVFVISLRENVKFHLYMNAAPKGDASRFLCRDDDAEQITERDLLLMAEGHHYPDFAVDSSNGCLTTLSSTGQIEECCALSPFRTFDEIQQEGVIKLATGSDKLMKWNSAGVQGALLGHIIQPIFISTVVLGSGYNHGHLSRAIAGRVDKEIFANLQNYKLNFPKIGRTSQRVPVETDSYPALSINWSLGDKMFEIVDSSTGRITDSSPFKSGATKASRVCKASFLSRFRALCSKVKRPDLAQHPNYFETKAQNRNYNGAKRMLLRHMDLKGFGQWLKMADEVGSFNK
ncbi:Adenosine deaminase domain-containing protein 1 [Holothuria leucospilota]|uniref:Adenosine deaminase domain-containing protein 1 n=1 Tax=Holothuria leucospilota TaxID=206669 RepID=A0A9Q1CEF4_HOLLE|nr:Adenosine deaminase domain-containing protein 1 [Holothuria leucospilota]